MSRTVGALGNPFGSRKKRWDPVKWNVDHEVCVLMHVSGKKREEIAETLGKTTAWVSLVVNCPKAEAVIEKIRKNLPIDQVSKTYAEIVEKARQRVADLLDNDEMAEKYPLQMYDRAIRAIDVLDRNLKPAASSSSVNIYNDHSDKRSIVLTNAENADRIVKALERSEIVTKKHREPLKLVAASDG